MFRLLIAVCLLGCSFIEAAPAKGKQQERHSHGKAKSTQAEDFVFKIDEKGKYTFSRNGTEWLQSAPSYLYTDGKKFSTSDGSLKLEGASSEDGEDKVGRYISSCYNYMAGTRQWKLCAKLWVSITPDQVPGTTIIFQQHFLGGTDNSAQKSTDHVISAFPAFQAPGSDTSSSLGLLSYQGSMFGGTGHFTSVWNAGGAIHLSGGITGGPVAIFDRPDGVCIMAPFSEFMSSSRYFDGDSRLNWGVMGGVKSVPEGFVQQTIVQCSSKGINEVFAEWGRFMRTYYDKGDNSRRSDLTLRYLGYWTDGGAYYYYNTEPNKNYEDTMLDVKIYTDSKGIPFRYVQYDSWFYPKGPHGGVMTWNATTEVAPDGFQYLWNKNKWPVGAHNRWWSPQTPYAKQNGGTYDFIIEEKKAIPQDLNFWMDLMRDSKLWGLILYEQDWLDREFGDMNVTQSTVDVAKNWLNQMGQAARANDLTIQYCMSNPRHAMQSLEIPVVTQARVSGDYRAGSDQWNIGQISIFADAMGIAPFKDTFWTTRVQPGNTYKLEETHAELQTVVSTLSTGPVGPSDMIGHTNVSMLMQCCRADGLVLKPDKPAMAIDKEFWQQAWSDGSGPKGEIWTTYTNIGQYYFGIVLATAMDDAGVGNSYSLTPTDAGFAKFNPTVAIRRSAQSVTPIFYPWTDQNPLTFTNLCTRPNFCMYYTSPVYYINRDPDRKTELVIYGEEFKFVPMSRDRVTDILTTDDDVIVTLQGTEGETIVFSNFLEGGIIRHSCTFDQSGTARLSLVDPHSSCTSA